MSALLRRYGKPAWKFDDELEHVTSRGTKYRIFMDECAFKPVWIGRLVETPTRASWVTWENELCADRIEFENGGVYYFPITRKDLTCDKH